MQTSSCLLSHSKTVYACEPNKEAWREKKEYASKTQMYILTYKYTHGKYFSESVHENDKQFKLNP